MTEHRKEAIVALKRYIDGEIKPKELLPMFQHAYEGDELLEVIINTFCEPLDDYTAISSWDEIAQVSIRAIEHDWSPDFFSRVLEEGLPSGDKK